MEEQLFDYPVDGILDLHMFQPKDVKSVLSEYLTVCRARGILRMTVIHGKGQGVLREIVRSFLKNSPNVIEFHTPSDASGWGATIAILKPLEIKEEST
jgi:DNA-nicking Smr family endonuclease